MDNSTSGADATGFQCHWPSARQLSVPHGPFNQCHATPAAAYSHNVHRDDYQDLTRDLIGLKSVMHPQVPLPGLDVLIGTGFGDIRKTDLVAATETEPEKNPQGSNFVPGNAYLTDADLEAIDARNGGKYITAIRTAGVNGRMHLSRAAAEAT